MDCLVVEWRHGRVSRMDFGEETRRCTNWWWNSSTEGSGEWTLARRRDNACTGGGGFKVVRQGSGDLTVKSCIHGPGSVPARPTCRVVGRISGGIKCGMGVVLTGGISQTGDMVVRFPS